MVDPLPASEMELLEMVLDELTRLTGLSPSINIPPWAPNLATQSELLVQRVDYVLGNIQDYVVDLRKRAMRLTELEQTSAQMKDTERYQSILRRVVQALPVYLQSTNWDELPRLIEIQSRKAAMQSGDLQRVIEEIRQTIPKRFQPTCEEPEKISRAINEWFSASRKEEHENG